MDNTELQPVEQQQIQGGELARIENEMLVYINQERRLWVKTFMLMNRVEKEELWKTGGYHSYSAWVNDFATRAELHVSLLWQRLKAGRAYLQYLQRAGVDNVSDALERTNASAESLVLVEKIAGKNAGVADDLIKKLESNELTRKDLSDAWHQVKSEKDKPYSGKSGKEKVLGRDMEKENTEFFFPEVVTAKDCINALDEWLHDMVDDDTEEYELYTEFPVRVPTAKHARRIDAVSIVGKAMGKGTQGYDVEIHGFEIKVDKNDLVKDEKMGEYVKFVDYFWLVVPFSLLDEARSFKAATWGIIAIKDKDAVVMDEATKLEGVSFRDITLATAWRKDHGCFTLPE